MQFLKFNGGNCDKNDKMCLTTVVYNILNIQYQLGEDFLNTRASTKILNNLCQKIKKKR